MKALSIVLICLGGFSFLLSVIVKVLHWPGMNIFRISSLLFLLIGVALLLIFRKNRINS